MAFREAQSARADHLVRTENYSAGPLAARCVCEVDRTPPRYLPSHCLYLVQVACISTYYVAFRDEMRTSVIEP